MKLGVATDHGGFALKAELVAKLNGAGHQVVDFGAYSLNPHDDYPDFVIPLAEAVASGKVDRGLAICGSGVGASVCANKVPGVRAGLIHDHYSARQGVEDDHMNILCMGGRTVGPEVAWDVVQRYLTAEYSQAERHLRRLGKVARLEAQRFKNVKEDGPMIDQRVAELSINTIRTLSIDAVQQAKSGHPGTPMALAPLARQALPTLDRSKYAAASGVSKGAYMLADTPGGKPDVILIASGSEVSLAVEAHEKLRADGIRSRVVSMPSWDVFEHQTQEYRDSVLPPAVTARVAIEQASTFGWERYVGLTGRVIGMHTFGASAPLKELQKKFGFEPDEIVTAAKEQIRRRAA